MQSRIIKAENTGNNLNEMRMSTSITRWKLCHYVIKFSPSSHIPRLLSPWYAPAAFATESEKFHLRKLKS